MIHIDRSKVKPPKVLADPNGLGAKERARALDFYDKNLDQGKSFPFKVYKNPEVTDTLDELFHHKCAYCESPYGATQKVAVEHYRPKGSVLVNSKISGRGYYWLAADWDNLLPSCTDCNSPRTQKVTGEKARVLGKGTEFPIANEAKRAVRPGQESQERRLLLNPCLDNPDEHLVFEEEGEEVIVRPAIKPNGKESPMGRESIRVFGLRRMGLAEARRDRMIWIKAQLSRIDRYISRLNKDPENEDNTNLLNEEMLVLDKLLEDDQPYAGMARQYVQRYFPG
jgi:uncharacterized protein (TIGR02646 family)